MLISCIATLFLKLNPSEKRSFNVLDHIPSGSTATFVNDHKLNGFFYLGDDLSIKLKKINNEGKSISPVHETGVDSMPYIFLLKRIEYNTSENSFYKILKTVK